MPATRQWDNQAHNRLTRKVPRTSAKASTQHTVALLLPVYAASLSTVHARLLHRHSRLHELGRGLP